MAFCGRCGLLLNSDAQKCPRCGMETDFDAFVPGTPTSTNEATFIAHTDKTQLKETPHTPSPPPASSPGYPGLSDNNYTPAGTTDPAYTPRPGYPTERASSPGYIPQSGPNYPVPGDATPSYTPQSSNNYIPQRVSQPGFYPGTDPGYPFQLPVAPRRKQTWPFILAVLLVFLLGAGTAAVFILGPTHFPQLFGSRNTVTPTVVLTARPTAQPQDTPTAQPTVTPSPTAQPTVTPSQPAPQALLQAQTAVQQYFTDINNKDYQSAYNLWVNNPDNFTHYKQGFAHTQRDDITLGDTTQQSDGTVQVNITIQSTEDAASGTGTQVSTYQGYYNMGQQADGSWKIITASINRI